MDIKKHVENDKVYDRILTSNLIDHYLPLPDLLQLCSQMLNHDNNHATIITETILWARDIIPKADINWPANLPRVPKLEKIASADTKQSEPLGGTFVREYMENFSEFLSYFRAMFYAWQLKKYEQRHATHKKPTIPVISELGHEFQLRLRDFLRNENKIAFFRPVINRRIVSIVSGMDRSLEWIPLKK